MKFTDLFLMTFTYFTTAVGYKYEVPVYCAVITYELI